MSDITTTTTETTERATFGAWASNVIGGATMASARRDVEGVRESDVEALRRLTAEDLAQSNRARLYFREAPAPMVEALRAHVVALTDDADVVDVAVMKGAALLVGDPDRVVRRAAAAGVKQARAVVAAYRSAEYVRSETVRAFTEAPPVDGAGRPDTGAALRGAGLSPITSPAADVRWNLTRGDLARSLAHVFCVAHRTELVRAGGEHQVPGRVRVCVVEGVHAGIWQDTLRAYATHRCERCAASKRPALAGILAHTRGLDRTHSEAWRLRRLFVAAAEAAAPRVAVLAEAYAAHQSHRDVEHSGARREWTADDVARLVEALAYVEALPRTVDVVAPVHPLAFDVERVERVERVTHPQRVWHVDVEALRTGRDRFASEAPRGVFNRALRTHVPSLFDPRTLADVEGAFARRAPLSGVVREARTVEVARVVAHVVPRRVEAPATDVEALALVTVRTRTGEAYTRPLRGACEAPCWQAGEPERCTHDESAATQRARTREARFDGEAYGEGSGRANTPDPRTGAVGSGKAPQRPRKGTRGASGPNVPAGRHSAR